MTMGMMVVTEKNVKKQLELDLKVSADDAQYQAPYEPCAEVICLSGYKISLASRSSEINVSVNKDTIKSRIDSLLARYK